MKILILNPPAYNGIDFIREGRCEQRLSSFQYVMVPITLPYIAAVLLKENFEVKILDCIAEGVSPEALLTEVQRFAPRLVIVNTSTVTYDADLALAGRVKGVSSTHISAIGIHVSVLSEETLLKLKIDSIIRFEPELTALSLARALSGKGDLSSVEGLSFKKDGKVIHNAARPFIDDLDTLPFPARQLLKNELYRLPVINEPYTLLVPSRGCPYPCNFCTASLYYGQKLRKRSPENIGQELEEIVNRHKVKNVTFWSDTFTLDRNFIVAICAEIRKRGLRFSWMSNARVDRVDAELLKAMRACGCIGISYGVESGAQEILDSVGKGTNLEQIKNAFKWTKEAGIETLAHVIFGLPGETKETVKKTVRFIKEIDPDYAQFYCAVPFPGTKFYEMARDNHWIITKDWSRFELNQAIIDTPSLSAKELGLARMKAYHSFYLRPRYICSRLSKIKTWKDLSINTRQAWNFTKQWVLKT